MAEKLSMRVVGKERTGEEYWTGKSFLYEVLDSSGLRVAMIARSDSATTWQIRLTARKTGDWFGEFLDADSALESLQQTSQAEGFVVKLSNAQIQALIAKLTGAGESCDLDAISARIIKPLLGSCPELAHEVVRVLERRGFIESVTPNNDMGETGKVNSSRPQMWQRTNR